MTLWRYDAPLRNEADLDALIALCPDYRNAEIHYRLSPVLCIARTRDGEPAAAGGALWLGDRWEVWLITGKRWLEVAMDVSRYARDILLPGLSGEKVIATPDLQNEKSVLYLAWLGFAPSADGAYYWQG